MEEIITKCNLLTDAVDPAIPKRGTDFLRHNFQLRLHLRPLNDLFDCNKIAFNVEAKIGIGSHAMEKQSSRLYKTKMIL